MSTKDEEDNVRKQCYVELQNMLVEYGGQTVLHELGKVLCSGSESMGNGYNVGKVLIELARVEW